MGTDHYRVEEGKVSEKVTQWLHGSADKICSIASNPDVAELSYH
jgi:hypothetical protein